VIFQKRIYTEEVMASTKYNTGMGLGALAGLLAAYFLEHYAHPLYVQLANITLAPAIMWGGLWLGKQCQKKYFPGHTDSPE
jgi:hypothetical protein